MWGFDQGLDDILADYSKQVGITTTFGVLMDIGMSAGGGGGGRGHRLAGSRPVVVQHMVWTIE